MYSDEDLEQLAILGRAPVTLIEGYKRMREALLLLANEDSYKPIPDATGLQVIHIAKTALRESAS